jgi:REP element-mobilizing transposase RayT
MERYRLHPEAAAYYLTYAIVEWLPLLVSQATCTIITDSLAFCHRDKHLRINAYVIMPTHMHLIVFDAALDLERLLRTLADFRKYTGRQLSEYCTRQGPKCFLETLRSQATADRERRLWQPSRHPEALQGERFWQQKLDYLHDNPCRKGLVRRPDHWRYSSAAWYMSEGVQAVDVPLTPIAW